MGAAHIGVLKALRELEITVDYVAGTSIGAFIGTFHAFDMSCEDMEEVTKELGWLDVSGLSLSKYGVLSNDKQGDLLRKRIGDVNFKAAKIPLAMIA